MTRPLLFLALSALATACVVHDDSSPSSSSPIDDRLASPNSPAIDAHFDLVFGAPCLPQGPGGIAGWQISVEGVQGESGLVPCFDTANQAPYAVRFENLAPSTDYVLDATGYAYDPSTGQADRACFQAHCTARTAEGALAVLPTCTVTSTC